MYKQIGLSKTQQQKKINKIINSQGRDPRSARASTPLSGAGAGGASGTVRGGEGGESAGAAPTAPRGADGFVLRSGFAGRVGGGWFLEAAAPQFKGKLVIIAGEKKLKAVETEIEMRTGNLCGSRDVSGVGLIL